MNKHTPGPWVISEEQRETLAGHVVLRRICSVCTDHGALMNIRINSLEGDLAADECAATARLIAAAPELLEALVEISHALADGSLKFTRPRQSDSDPYHKANVLMCAAIEKATA